MSDIDLNEKISLDTSEAERSIERVLADFESMRELVSTPIRLMLDTRQFESDLSRIAAQVKDAQGSSDGAAASSGGSKTESGKSDAAIVQSGSELLNSFGKELFGSETAKYGNNRLVKMLEGRGGWKAIGMDVAGWTVDFLGDSVTYALDEGVKVNNAAAKECAQSLSELEEALNSLKLGIGNGLIPVITAAANGLAGLLGGGGDQQKKEYEEADIEAHLNAAVAQTALDMLQNAEAGKWDTASGRLERTVILSELEAAAPGILDLIDPRTGQLRQGIVNGSLDDYWKNLISEPVRTYEDQKFQAVIDAQNAYTSAQLEFEAANALVNQLDAETKKTHYSVTEINNMLGVKNKISPRVRELNNRKENLFYELQDAKEAYAKAIGLSDDEIYGKGSTAIDAAIEAQLAYNEALENERLTYDRLMATASAAQAYRDSVVDATRSRVNSLVSGFEAMGELPQKSLEEMIAGLADQQEYTEEYQENLRKAADMGVNRGLLASLADGSEQSAAYLKAIVSGSKESVDTLNAQWEDTQTGKESFAQTLADMQLAADETFTGMVESLGQMIEEFDQQEEARASTYNTASGLTNGLLAGYEDFVSVVNAYRSEIEALAKAAGLNLSLGSGLSGAGDGDMDGAGGVGKTAPYGPVYQSDAAPITYSSGLGGLSPIALAASPYDSEEFAALAAAATYADGLFAADPFGTGCGLSPAAAYADGLFAADPFGAETGLSPAATYADDLFACDPFGTGSGPSPAGGPAAIDYDRLAASIASALNGAIVQMDGQAVGNLVTDTVSRNIAARAMGTRRYVVL